MSSVRPPTRFEPIDSEAVDDPWAVVLEQQPGRRRQDLPLNFYVPDGGRRVVCAVDGCLEPRARTIYFAFAMTPDSLGVCAGCALELERAGFCTPDPSEPPWRAVRYGEAGRERPRATRPRLMTLDEVIDADPGPELEGAPVELELEQGQLF